MDHHRCYGDRWGYIYNQLTTNEIDTLKLDMDINASINQ